jgi:hypothetical protein
MTKKWTAKRLATLAADPSIMKKLHAKRLATLAANPEINKKRAAKTPATLAADPDIQKRRIAKLKATLAANPDISKKRTAKRLATRAKKRELHTPYGVFTFLKGAAEALANQDGFPKNKLSTETRISKLVKTNPKEWYWVKKT